MEQHNKGLGLQQVKCVAVVTYCLTLYINWHYRVRQHPLF